LSAGPLLDCLEGIARVRLDGAAEPQSRFVHRCSERTLEPVRQDYSFVTKQEPSLRSWSSAISGV
jgi:hypothetical protein